MTDTDRPRVWGIHATEEPRLLIERNCIALGWERIGDLSKMPREREAFKAEYARLRESFKESKQAVANVAGQLLRFAWEAKAGDYVVYPMPGKADVYVGRITGEYRCEPSAVIYNQQRDVEWLGHWERFTFTPGAQSAMGVLMTFWEMTHYASEFLKRVGVFVAGESLTHEQVVFNHLYSHLSGHDFEAFVAELFRLYEYDTIETPRSGDHGIDIIATRHGGLFAQKVKVQVKRLNAGVAEATVQQLRGCLNEGELGVIVAYSGLQRAAQDFAERHGIAVVDGERLLALAIQHEKELAVKFPQVFRRDADDDRPDEEDGE